jgi:hypothetical protein
MTTVLGFARPIRSLIFCAMMFQTGGLACAASFSHTLQLRYGWSAVWLEVGPVAADGRA